MDRKKLQILIPQYNETDEIIKPLLTSISIQQSIDFNEIGVIICNDGSEICLSDSFLKSFPYNIDYYKEPHKGVSATRNFCLDKATSEYIMFCDADDMFSDALGLWRIFKEFKKGFDTLTSTFWEELKYYDTGNSYYEIREKDGIFIHGKVHRLKYLKDLNICFDENLYINEDSYFIGLCQSLTKNHTYIKEPFYIWKWRNESTSHHDPKYEFKAYWHMIKSNDALVQELKRRMAEDKALLYVIQMYLDAYATLTDPIWSEQDNIDYYNTVIDYFMSWSGRYEKMWKSAPVEIKIFVIMQLIENMTRKEALHELYKVDAWIKTLEAKDEK